MEAPIELLSRILTKEFVRELYEESGAHFRESMFNPAMVIWLMIQGRLSGQRTLNNLLDTYREGVGGAFVEWQVEAKEALSRSTSGISQARSRVPVPVVYGVVAAIEEEIRMSHEKHTWQGQRAFIIDGTDFRVKAEGDLVKKYPPYRAGKRRSPWSNIRSCIGVDVVSGVALRPESGAMFGKVSVGEVPLAKRLMERLPKNSIVIADRGLGTFAVAYTAVKGGHDVLLRLTEARAKQACGKSAIKGEQEIVWQVGRKTQGLHAEIAHNATLDGRIIKHVLKRQGYRDIVLFLFTTLTHSVEDIVALYKLRWRVETDIRTIKTTIEMGLLDTRSVNMVEKEIALGIAAYNIIRHLMAYGAKRSNIEPRDISFSRYRSMIRTLGAHVLYEKTSESERLGFEEWLTKDLQQIKIPQRPGRSEPRKILRQPRPFPFLVGSRSRARKNNLA